MTNANGLFAFQKRNGLQFPFFSKWNIRHYAVETKRNHFPLCYLNDWGGSRAPELNKQPPLFPANQTKSSTRLPFAEQIQSHTHVKMRKLNFPNSLPMGNVCWKITFHISCLFISPYVCRFLFVMKIRSILRAITKILPVCWS